MAIATPSAYPQYAGMSAQQVAMAQAQAQAYAQQIEQNRRFMALGIDSYAYAKQANGNAEQIAFSSGQPLTWNIGTSENAFLMGFWIELNLTVNLPTGTPTPSYALNSDAPWTLIQRVVVKYGGQQHDIPLHILPKFHMMRKRLAATWPRNFPAGVVDSYLESYYSSGAMTSAIGNNTVTARIYFPMNLLHQQDVRGILPVQAGETTCQVVLTCASAPVGPDPLINTYYQSVSGSSAGQATVTGNVAILARYKNGMTYSQQASLQPNMSGIETVQFVTDAPLNTLGTGRKYPGKVSYLHKIPWLFCQVVDGNQSNKTAATSNIAYLGTSADANGQRPFQEFGYGTDLDVRVFYDQLSDLLQQDLPEGFIPWIYGPIFQQSEAGLLEGQHYLDMTIASGWPDFHYRFQFNTLGTVSGISPRVETYAVILNAPLIS